MHPSLKIPFQTSVTHNLHHSLECFQHFQIPQASPPLQLKIQRFFLIFLAITAHTAKVELYSHVPLICFTLQIIFVLVKFVYIHLLFWALLSYFPCYFVNQDNCFIHIMPVVERCQVTYPIQSKATYNLLFSFITYQFTHSTAMFNCGVLDLLFSHKPVHIPPTNFTFNLSIYFPHYSDTLFWLYLTVALEIVNLCSEVILLITLF